MKNDVAYYVDEYIHLCSLLCKQKADYTKEKVKKHNAAITKLIKLQNEIAGSRLIAKEVYNILLNNEDDDVRHYAATECLEQKIHTDNAVAILEYLSKNGNHMQMMAAERSLRVWRGELDPNSPF